MRNLATIQTIKSLDPIPGKDKIVLASFENVGWHVIVGKPDFKVGDKCIYIEADSILPQKPEFEFLRPRCWSPKWNGFRIRNMKMGGVYSEGIVFPYSILPEKLPGSKIPAGYFTDGTDLTEQLGIVKYDPEALEEAKLMETRKKNHGPIVNYFLRFPFIKKLFYPTKGTRGWPDWASHTDETRAQILSYIYDNYQGLEVYVTEKVDGQSLTAGWVKGKFTLCSRNIGLPKPSKLRGKFVAEKSKYWQTVELYDLENKLKRASKDMGIDLYIQGEQCGPTIQGNKYEFEGLRFFLYNIFDITHQRYFGLREMADFCNRYEIPFVRLLEERKFNWKSIEELLEYSKSISSYNYSIPREGIVIRAANPLPPGHKMANMLSFKVINPDFDLKYNKEEH